MKYSYLYFGTHKIYNVSFFLNHLLNYGEKKKNWQLKVKNKNKKVHTKLGENIYDKKVFEKNHKREKCKNWKFKADM